MKTSIAKFAKSKFFIPGIVIGLVVLGWFILILGELGPSEEPEGSVSTTWSQKEDYKIIETPEGTFVENEKAGLTFKVPDGWRVEIGESVGGIADVDFLEKNARLEPEWGFFIGGCAIELEINYNYNEALAESTQGIISYLEQHPEEDEKDIFMDVISVDHHKALKQIGRASSKFGKSINVEILLKEKLCRIRTRPLLEEEERCLQELDKFLETVSIK